MAEDSDTLALEEIDIAGIDEYPADTSVKLFGPPGTGKTTNAAARVAKLIEEHGYSIGDVVWITYRKSLAMDTLKRLARWGVIDTEELADPGRGATKFINTAHAVANRVVGGAGEPVGYGDKKAFCKKRNLKYDKSTPWEQPPGQLLFDVFDYAKKNQLDPTDDADLRKIPAVEDLREKYRGSIPRAYEDWEAYKDANDKIDFWEMLAAPLEEGRTPGKPVLVVDEYHDAYPLMADLAEKWADAADVVIVAGDPHQVVNTYDGADPEFYRRMDYPEILLPTTYRVPYEHWDPATSLLANAHDPPDVERVSRGRFEVQRSPGFTHSKASGWNVPAPSDEYSPAWLVDEYGDDIMLLTRTTHQLDGVARALERAGILFEVPTSSDAPGWQAPPNEEMSDRVAIYNALQKITRLEPATFDDTGGGIQRFTSDDGGDPSRVIFDAKEAAALLDHANAQYLAESRSTVTEAATSWLTAEESVTAVDVNEYVEPEFWGTYTYGQRSTHYLNKRGKALGSYFGKRDFDALGNALRENDYPTDGSLPTKVYTIHASKGNEAETVAVYDGITKRIRESMNRDEAERKNEWRTWYVALTRASSNLLVLKHGFDFTKEFLPRGRALMDSARQGVVAADGGGSA